MYIFLKKGNYNVNNNYVTGAAYNGDTCLHDHIIKTNKDILIYIFSRFHKLLEVI